MDKVQFSRSSLLASETNLQPRPRLNFAAQNLAPPKTFPPFKLFPLYRSRDEPKKTNDDTDPKPTFPLSILLLLHLPTTTSPISIMTVLRSSLTPLIFRTAQHSTKKLALKALTSQTRSISAFGYTQAAALVYNSYGPPTDKLHLHHHSIPPAYGTELTVKFLASPINPADINQIEGVYPSKPELTRTLGTSEPSAVGGNEGVVEIVAVGGKVQGWKKGDWAIMKSTKFGTWRTHASATAEQLLKVPSDGSITPIQAATVSVNPCTAYRMLKDFVPLEKGDWFIQNGGNSGVGRAAIQLARIWGLRSINVVRDRPDIEELREELEGLGADLVITDKELADKSVKHRIDRITGGKGVGLALNCVGGDSATNLMRNLKYVYPRRSLCQLSYCC